MRTWKRSASVVLSVSVVLLGGFSPSVDVSDGLLQSRELSSSAGGSRQCPPPWKGAASGFGCGFVQVTLRVNRPIKSAITPGKSYKSVTVLLRSGYLQENPETKFKGNVVYLQGLGDSIVNQLPLFSRLTDAGYRVIAFDYPGQGGSEGSMDDTRIRDIPVIGSKLLRLYGRDTEKSRKVFIGWSTGGLAAYYGAAQGWSFADAVVLIAPGVAPNFVVGEGLLHWPIDEITLPTLTSADYENGEENPHLEPIKPRSPIFVPAFAIDLQTTARRVRKEWHIPNSLQGFVLLGTNDNYVNSDGNRAAIEKAAPHFQIKEYPGARHEIQNEARAIRAEAHEDILEFLNGLR